MSDIAPRKQEHDYTQDVDALFADLDKDSSSAPNSKVDRLLVLEKKTRNDADMTSTARVLIKIIDTVQAAGDWEGVNSQLSALSKKHGQLREATRRMVDRAMEYMQDLEKDSIDEKNHEIRLKLIETLREVTEGKIYLEVPRARITRMLASIKEGSGDVTAASDLLQDLQVETFASMERREKLEFIIEQMRLLRLKENWDMLGIVCKKVNTKWLEEVENEDLKFKYYGLMIQYSLQMDKYLEAAKHYRSVYNTPSIKDAADADAKWQPVLRNMIFFVVLAPYDNEQSDMLHRILKDEEDRLSNQLTEVYNLAKCFTTPELTRWPRIESLYGELLRQTRIFGPNGVQGVPGDIEQEVKNGEGEKRYEELHKRVVEHNIRTVAKYYTKISVARLSQLLDLDRARTEESLCTMVVEKSVYAKIDRPTGVVDFRERNKSTYKILNEWSKDVGKLMALVEATSHLIGKEHAIAQAAKQRAAAVRA